MGVAGRAVRVAAAKGPSCAHHVLGLIAEGPAHIYLPTGSKENECDTCGPEAILREAGGSVTDNYGEPLGYNVSEIRNQHGIVATNGIIQEQVVAATKAVLADYRQK